MATRSNVTPIRVNYKILVECVDCGTRYECPKTDASDKLINAKGGGPPGRVITVCVPNACPTCHNIRLVREDKTG